MNSLEAHQLESKDQFNMKIKKLVQFSYENDRNYIHISQITKEFFSYIGYIDKTQYISNYSVKIRKPISSHCLFIKKNEAYLFSSEKINAEIKCSIENENLNYYLISTSNPINNYSQTNKYNEQECIQIQNGVATLKIIFSNFATELLMGMGKQLIINELKSQNPRVASCHFKKVPQESDYLDLQVTIKDYLARNFITLNAFIKNTKVGTVFVKLY
jgi:hypothetical protein